MSVLVSVLQQQMEHISKILTLTVHGLRNVTFDKVVNPREKSRLIC